MPVFAQTPVTYQYAYDSAGRLTQAVDSSGVELTYTYDAAGNLLSVTRQINVLTAIFGATDANGNTITAAKIGQQVTLSGIGLGDCPNVTVTVDGITATIVSQTTNTITFLIPVGATAGNIVVSTCHGSATFTLTIGGVVVAPPRAVLTPGGTVQFTASVLPSTLAQGVTWSVDGIDGGDASVGTITADGLYTAPPGTGFVQIRATSLADPELYGDAQVSVLDSSNVYEAFSPGLSVLFGSQSGTTLAGSAYALSPGVSVAFRSPGGAVTAPVYVLSPGLSVVRAPAGGAVSAPIYVVSPGVSVIRSASGGIETPVYVLSPGLSVGRASAGGSVSEPVYAVSPGVSVLIPPVAGGTFTAPVYVLSPGVSVGFPTTLGALGSAPVYVLSPGVSVGYPPIPESLGEASVFVLSPGVSVGPATGVGRARLLPTGHPLQAAVLAASQVTRRKGGLVTVTGTHLEDVKALGFLTDAGRLDPNITIQSAVVEAGGRAMTLRLIVHKGELPDRRRLVVWTLPRTPFDAGRGVHFQP